MTDNWQKAVKIKKQIGVIRTKCRSVDSYITTEAEYE